MAAVRVVEFQRQAKGDSHHPHGVADDDQLLQAVLLWSIAGPDAAPQLVRSWHFDYEINVVGQYSLLRGVTVDGTDGGVLPALHLDYPWRRVDFWDGYLDAAYAYDGWGNRVMETVFGDYGGVDQPATTGPRTTTTTYDSQGVLPLAQTNPLGQTVLTTYDARFQSPTTVTDANGARTSSHYDQFGRLVQVDLPGCAAAVQASYGEAALTHGKPYFERLQQRVDDCAAATPTYNDLYVFYDGLGRKLQAQQLGDNGETILTGVIYDAGGRLAQVGAPVALAGAPGTYRANNFSAGLTRTLYDTLDRPVQVTAADGSVTRREYGWDDAGAAPTLGLLTRTFDANNHRKEQVSDEWGNLMRVREYSGGGVGESPYGLYGELRYTYDVQNQLIAVTDAAGNTTTLAYDALGRKTSMVDPDMGAWRYTYNPLGDLIEQTDAQGVVTQLRYDKLSRLIGKTYVLPAGSEVAATPAVQYYYDALPGGTATANGIGRRVAMTDGAGSVTWTYDAQGRVLSESRTFSGRYAQLANHRDDGAYVTRYAYNAANWLLSTTYPDGDVVTTDYTRRGLPRRHTSSMGGDLVLDASYNALGQLTRQVTGDGLITTYDYNPATRSGGRLLQLRVGENDLHLAYTYDNVGNISAIYDASQGVLGERIVYRYDHLDRLIAAKAEGGVLAGYTLGYEYDAVGNMTARSVAGQEMRYQYSGDQPHAVTDVANDEYIYDANGNMVTRSEDGITYQQRWNAFNKLAQVRWQREDHQCNVQFVYDGDGNRLLKVEGQASLELTTYYAGQMFEKQFNSTANPLGEGGAAGGICAGAANGVTDYGFTGQRNEISFGLMDFNARYYSPRLGRFISPDTIVPDPTTVKGFNRYAYAYNSPVQYSDPSGHCSTLDDGTPDTNGDAECWQLAYSIYGLGQAGVNGFQDDWKVSPEEWLQSIAGGSFATADYLQPFFDKYNSTWKSSVGLSAYIPNQAPPSPEIVETFKELYFGPLHACAVTVNGACGVSYGGTGITPGAAGRFSGDFYVDLNGDFALYTTVGAGPAVMLFPQAMASQGFGAMAVPNTNVNDVGGWSVQIGSSGALGAGPAVDLVVAVSETAETGVVVGAAYGTWNAEGHIIMAYSWQVYSSRHSR